MNRLKAPMRTPPTSTTRKTIALLTLQINLKLIRRTCRPAVVREYEPEPHRTAQTPMITRIRYQRTNTTRPRKCSQGHRTSKPPRSIKPKPQLPPPRESTRHNTRKKYTNTPTSTSLQRYPRKERLKHERTMKKENSTQMNSDAVNTKCTKI